MTTVGPHPAVDAYLREVRSIRSSGAGTSERSFYPALRQLLQAIGSAVTPPCVAVTDPSGRDGNFPDVAILERDTRVMVLPVEVKPADVTVAQLLALNQATRYADSFGGGWVLLTNLYQFVLAKRSATGVDAVLQVSLVQAPRNSTFRRLL